MAQTLQSIIMQTHKSAVTATTYTTINLYIAGYRPHTEIT